AADIIKKYINTIGGETKLKAVKELKLTDTSDSEGVVLIRISDYKNAGDFRRDVVLPSYDNAIFSHIVVKGDSVSVNEKGMDMPVGPGDKNAICERHKFFPELDYRKAGHNF